MYKIGFVLIVFLASFTITSFVYGQESDNQTTNEVEPDESREDLGIIVGTDKTEYGTGDSLIISGLVLEKKMPVIAMRIFDPTRGILSANNIEIEEDDTFSKIIFLDSPFYDDTGIYKITFDYGKLSTEIFFEIKGENISDDSILEPEEFVEPEIVLLLTDKLEYQDNDIIIIEGIVSSIGEPAVLVGIYDPFGVPVGFYFGEIDSNLEFSVNFLVKASVNFRTEGTYTVIAHYGESRYEINFDYSEKIVNETQPQKQPVEDSSENENNTEEQRSDYLPTQKNPPQESKSKGDSIKDSFDKKQDISTSPENGDKTPVIKEKPSYENNFRTNKNLSVEDIELGILLNQMTLNCDGEELADSISYYDDMGPALIRLCKYSDAIFYFDKTLNVNPQNVEALTNKGTALSKLGHFDEAIIYFDSALKINPEFIPALNNKANVLSQLGNYEDSIYFYKIALQSIPEYKIAQSNLEKTIAKVAITKHQMQEKKELEAEISADFNSYDGKLEPQNKTNKIFENKSFNKNDQNNSNMFEQIGNVLSSIGESIFGFIV